MRNVYYRYDPHTLNYERVFPSWKQRIWVVFRHLIVGILIGAGMLAVALYAFDSPREQQLKKNNKLLLTQYQVLSRRMTETQKVLVDLQSRDDQLYRAIFQADPIPSSIRGQGVTGANRYDNLMDIPGSHLVVSTSQKMDMITRQVYVQSNSFDEISNLIKSQEDRLKCVPAIQPVSNKDLTRIASGYGIRIDPIYRTPRFHTGMDFNAKVGTDIYATGDGVVEMAEWYQGYGNCVVINHGYNFKTLYGHCNSMKVRPGQRVTRGEVIATVGNTGKSTGPHLHYEVLVRGVHDNPAKYYFMDLTPEEYNRMIVIAENHGQVMD